MLQPCGFNYKIKRFVYKLLVMINLLVNDYHNLLDFTYFCYYIKIFKIFNINMFINGV